MSHRLLMICLDAAEHTLIQRWMDAGRLPNLAGLRAKGSFQPLRSSADWLSGSAWSTHHTGQWPGEHGHYHYIQWHAQRMAVERIEPDWAGIQPFWRTIARQGRRVIAFDMPMTFKPEPDPNLIEICGWATHDVLDPYFAVPESIKSWLHQTHGTAIRSDEYYGLMSLHRFQRTRDELVTGVERASRVAEDLMEREPWDLFLTTFGATHRGGHKLWDLSCVTSKIPVSQRSALENALQEVYMAADAAVGRLAAAAGPDTMICVYAIHGMGPNTSYTDLLPQMLAQILAGRPEEGAGWLKQARDLVPLAWRQRVKHALPLRWQDRLTTYWRMGITDWSQTQAVAVVADNQGYIRINKREREAAGIVDPGADYDQLCQQIIAGLESFVDADTGVPIVDRAARVDEVIAPGERSHLLPDIIVRWAEFAAHDRRAITSPQYGRIPWPTPGRMPDGRSGNHQPHGFWLTNNPADASSITSQAESTADIAPTVYTLLDMPVPDQLQGQSFVDGAND